MPASVPIPIVVPAKSKLYASAITAKVDLCGRWHGSGSKGRGGGSSQKHASHLFLLPAVAFSIGNAWAIGPFQYEK
jgi:hypothetical protein